MKVLVIGGTRFFGLHTVDTLLKAGHDVTIATRGLTKDPFGHRVNRIIFDRNDAGSIQKTFGNTYYDVVIDKIAYCSNDVKAIMDVIHCGKYILMSSTAVYDPKSMDTREAHYNGGENPLIWCDRADFSYGEVKRQAENALCQAYPDRNWIIVRYPFVLGTDDYTKRLRFYVEHTMKSIPMDIDDLELPMGYIRSDEAGAFMAFLAEQEFSGAINGSSYGTISLREIIRYVEEKTGATAILSPLGDPAPYNGEGAYSINVEKAEQLGFTFSHLKDWIFQLLDHYISQIERESRE